MPLKTPEFWKKRNFISYALIPLSILYWLAFIVKKHATKKHQLNQKVIAIGNVVAGGAGKTPCAIAINEFLKKKGVKTTFLTRGYGGKIKTPTLLDKSMNASKTGDEAQLLAKNSDVVISPKRYLAKKILDRLNPDYVIMDDGLQHFSIHQDVKILVIDGKFLFGNAFPIPAGPLRECYKAALKKADIVILVGVKKVPKIISDFKSKIYFAQVKATSKPDIKKSYVAFSALANNAKFFDSLKQAKLKIAERKEFSDHYKYKNTDIEKLIKLANEKKSSLITTSKDMVKIPKKFHKEILEFKIKLEIEIGFYEKLKTFI